MVCQRYVWLMWTGRCRGENCASPTPLRIAPSLLGVFHGTGRCLWLKYIRLKFIWLKFKYHENSRRGATPHSRISVAVISYA